MRIKKENPERDAAMALLRKMVQEAEGTIGSSPTEEQKKVLFQSKAILDGDTLPSLSRVELQISVMADTWLDANGYEQCDHNRDCIINDAQDELLFPVAHQRVNNGGHHVYS